MNLFNFKNIICNHCNRKGVTKVYKGYAVCVRCKEWRPNLNKVEKFKYWIKWKRKGYTKFNTTRILQVVKN